MGLNPTVRVKAIMTKDIVSIEKSLSIRSAIKTMVRRNVGSVVITAHGKPVGIVTERDILKSLAYRKAIRPETNVEVIMSKPLVVVKSNATISEAAEIMAKHKIRRLLVKENNNYVGIVTQRDIQHAMTDTFKSLLLL
ncbi:MAG: CBS domain-containing protein [Nitrososphaerales archaeon]